MRGLILAAGRGSRLDDLTADRPKCLVEFNGKSLLSRQIASLRGAGIPEIGIVTGYRGETIELAADVCFRNERWETTGVIGTLRYANSWLSEGPVLASYSDIFYSAETVRRTIESSAGIAVAYDPDWAQLWSRRFVDPFADAETFEIDDQLRVTEIGNPASSAAPPPGQFIGLVRFLPHIWKFIENNLSTVSKIPLDVMDMTTLLRLAIGAGIEVEAIPVAGPWGEVDHPSDLKLYAEIYPDI